MLLSIGPVLTCLPGPDLICLPLPLKAILKGQELGASEVTADRCQADVSLMCWLSFLASWFYIRTKALATAASLGIDHKTNEQEHAACPWTDDWKQVSPCWGVSMGMAPQQSWAPLWGPLASTRDVCGIRCIWIHRFLLWAVKGIQLP